MFLLKLPGYNFMHSSDSLFIGIVIRMLEKVVQWNLIITVTLGPNLAGCYIEVAFLLSGIQNQHSICTIDA